jgi:hypothetical protein
MARSGSRKERERIARSSQPRARPFDTSIDGIDPALVARHEAGHAVVAHAVGQHPVYLTCIPRLVPVGDPENPTDAPLRGYGFHLAEPFRTDEINERVEAGLPFTADQVEWVRQEAVISVAGPIAEGKVAGADLDIDRFINMADVLGYAEERDGELFANEEFESAVIQLAERILFDYARLVVSLGKRLLARRELHAADIDAFLAGTVNGSHRHLLAELPSSRW